MNEPLDEADIERTAEEQSRKIMTNEEIDGFFSNAKPHIQGNPNLRDPQVEGWFLTGTSSYEAS